MGAIPKDLRIQEAVRLLNEDSSCTLAELASRCHLSISRLSHLFKAETGLTVDKYRRNSRFQVAAQILATTDLPIKQVAYALDYHHPSSFARAFELYFGVSPRHYRRHKLK